MALSKKARRALENEAIYVMASCGAGIWKGRLEELRNASEDYLRLVTGVLNYKAMKREWHYDPESDFEALAKEVLENEVK